MKKCFGLIVLMWALSSNVQAQELIKSRVETNSWDAAVENFNRGLIRVDEGGYSLVNYIGCNVTVTNICVVSATNGFVYYSPDMPYRCGKAHLSDYPKVHLQRFGVQQVKDYKQTLKVGSDSVETTWRRYDYPTLQIDVVTTNAIKIEISVSTNVTPAQLEKCSGKCHLPCCTIHRCRCCPK